jgi:predicted DCC family thiol-disulfide oxidoreductase YuxK
MKATLIYDGECPLCCKAAEWAKSRSLPGSLKIAACDSLERMKQFPQLEQEDCERAPTLVLEDGTIFSGAELMPELCLRLRGYHWVAVAMGAPGLAWLSPFVYRTLTLNKKIFRILTFENTYRRS